MKALLKISEGEVVPTDEMNLIGKGAGLDSLKLVELCLTLEDKAQEIGLNLTGPQKRQCRNPEAYFVQSLLAEEFLAQSKKRSMIIVTGASRGLGRAVTERLIDSGEEVLGLSRN